MKRNDVNVQEGKPIDMPAHLAPHLPVSELGRLRVCSGNTICRGEDTDVLMNAGAAILHLSVRIASFAAIRLRVSRRKKRSTKQSHSTTYRRGTL